MSKNFKETQKYNQWWFWLFLFTLCLIPVSAIYQQLIMGEPFGEHPLSDSGIIVLSAGVFILVMVFFFIRLDIQIDSHGIQVKFFPFMRKKIKWDQIKSTKIINYKSITSGIRFSLKYGTIYRISGKKGLFLELKNGNKLLIGTQSSDRIKEVLNYYNHS